MIPIGLSFLLFAGNGTDLARWVWPPSITVPLVLAAAIYVTGAVKVYRRGTDVHFLSSQLLFFLAGWFSLVVALNSPLHEWSERRFWAHMTQHEILMLISAPLLLLGRPAYVALWALPMRFRVRIARFSRNHAFRSSWAAISTPLAAWLVYSAALWLWHTPVLFDSALRNDVVHGVQHACFLGSAMLFWWALLDFNGNRLTDGGAVLYLFSTTIQMSLLSSLLTFSPRIWYSPYLKTDMTPELALQDQQLGGLIMWVPAGAVLLLITLFFFWRWLQYSDLRWEYARDALFSDQGVTHR